ncbi:MAG: formate/nitrite transporter family protein [Anaerolineae bacterium]|nr:formate/nitrite transporter family protein [Anaerolineae bacterium]
MADQLRINALMPAEIAQRIEDVGVAKATMNWPKMFALAVLAGAFIALGGVFATVMATGASGMLPYGITKLLVGLVFCLGLILVVVAGAELFTGNNLIVMAWVSRKVSLGALLRNWAIVYAGNFVGSLLTAAIMFLTRQYTFDGGGLGQTALGLAAGKLAYDPLQAVALGMMCNALVCLAVWLTFSAQTTADKILSILFPITAFVAAGFEHCVANMYFFPVALFIKHFDPAFVAELGMDLSALTWGSFLVDNLLPVTIGNIIGGGVMVAAVYWFIYLRD